MKRLLALMLAVAATAIIGEATASAQTYGNGFQFGSGFAAGSGTTGSSNMYGGVFGPRRSFTREQPPYFAKYPPVYYSHIVKRPYGVSPYAAPAGIAPVEMSVPIPITLKNPFFKNKVEPVSDEAKPDESKTEHKTTWVKNPFVTNEMMQASYASE